jgi:peptide/nickel transport system substrate-binding protein
MVRKKTRALAALGVSMALVAGACGSDDGGDEGDATTTTAAEGGGEEGDTTTTAAEETEEEGGDEGAAEAGGTIRFAVEQEPTSFNYCNAGTNESWVNYIMQMVWPNTINVSTSGEITFDEELVTVEKTSDDPLTIVYEINPDATWSDGTPITAADFIFTAEAYSGGEETGTDEDGNPVTQYNSACTVLIDQIASIEGSGPDNKTVTVVLETPIADWPALFGEAIMPAHAVAAEGGGDPAVGFNEGFFVESVDLANIPSGAQYVIDSQTPGQGLTLVRNDSYWGEPGVLDTIDLPYITDGSQQPAALENGEIDAGFPQAQIDLVRQVQGIDGVNAEIGFGTFFEHLDFNARNPFLAELPVRQAIALGIDRQAIVTALPGQFDESAEVLNNRVYFPGDPRYVDNSGQYAERDVAAAQALLEGAGYVRNGDFYEKDGQPLSVRITWRDPNPRRQSTVELIQSQLAEVGIEIVLAPQPDFSFLDSGDFDLTIFGWTGGTVLSSTQSIYEAGGGQNFTGILGVDPSLYAAANIELDPDARTEQMNAIDAEVWNQMMSLPMFQVPEIIFSTDEFTGVQYNGYIGPIWNANTWAAAG